MNLFTALSRTEKWIFYPDYGHGWSILTMILSCLSHLGTFRESLCR